MVAINRYRWPLPTDPSGPPMTYPEPMPTFIPSMAPPATAAPPAPMAQAPAAPTDIAYPPAGFQKPQATAPETSQEDEEFNRQMEEERVEADWTRMSKRATAVLKVEADMQKARNAVAEAHKKATQRPSLEAPDEPLNRVFDKYVKGHAPMPTLEEYKASVRKPAPAEALSWTREAPELQDFYSAGGTPEELRGLRKEEADRITLAKYAPQYVAPFQDLTFGEGRELVGRQRAHREATMAPIREKLAGISERRKELKRLRKPPTWQDIFEQEQEVARIKAPRAPTPSSPYGKLPGRFQFLTPEEQMGAAREETLGGPKDLELWKQAEREVAKALGGSYMMGLDEEAREKYYPQIVERFEQLQSQFRKSPTHKAPTTKHTLGDIVEKGGKSYTVVGFDADGEPLVEPL